MLAQQDLSTYRISSWNGAFNSSNKRTLIFCQIVLFKISLGKLDKFLIEPNTIWPVTLTIPHNSKGFTVNSMGQFALIKMHLP